ncbi:MAG: mucoidy inhibitor MuiA family protein [bacterium]|nr:mucoidy inhibitor MuiA family protein [bacterium]
MKIKRIAVVITLLMSIVFLYGPLTMWSTPPGTQVGSEPATQVGAEPAAQKSSVARKSSATQKSSIARGTVKRGGTPAKIKAVSAIDSVTVFSYQAVVTRRFKKQVQPGRYLLEFSPLPVSLDDRSVRIRGKGTAAVKILNVRTKQQTYDVPLDKVKIAAEKKKRDALKLEAKLLSNRRKALNKKEKFLDNMVAETMKAISNPKATKTVDMEKYFTMSNLLEKQLNDIYERKTRLLERELQLDDKVSRQDRLLTRISGEKQNRAKFVLVDIQVQNPGTLDAFISYVVPNASWSPVYDLRMSTTDKSDTLVYSAMVTQKSGEDWKNVRLRLSTSRPAIYKERPMLKTSFLDLPSEKGAIVGVVTVLGNGTSGVSVTVTSAKGEKHSTVTNTKGAFFIPQLRPGAHEILVHLEGFNSIRLTDVQVKKGKIRKVAFRMQPSTIEEEIVVSGKAPIVDRQSTINTATLDKEFLNGIPAARDYSDVIRMAPGVSTPNTWQLDGVDVGELDKLPLFHIRHDGAEVIEGETATIFKATHRQTILKGSESQKVPIQVAGVPAEKNYFVVPAKSNNVFLEAEIKNSTKTPILRGPLNLFLDGMFINASKSAYILPNETFSVSLGTAEGIRVKRTLLKKPEAVTTAKLPKKTEAVTRGYQITIKNTRQRKAVLTVLDKIPVSKSEKITVETQITPKAKETKDKEGFLEWNLVLQPGAEKTIKVKYTVVFPKGLQVEEF